MNIDAVIGLIAGLFGGCLLGVFIACCCVAAGKADREMMALAGDERSADGGGAQDAPGRAN